MDTNRFIVGMILCTNYSQGYTNAIITKVDDKEITVLSDFGNEMVCSYEELQQRYFISPIWKECIGIGLGLPTIKERVERQIYLLNNVLKNL